jgi:hypothetical protein
MKWSLWRRNHRWEENITAHHGEMGVWIYRALDRVQGSYESGNEMLVSMKDEQFLE